MTGLAVSGVIGGPVCGAIMQYLDGARGLAGWQWLMITTGLPCLLVIDADLGLDDRLKVRSRLITGTHVPHPGIDQARVAAIQLELERPTPVWLDGERIGSARSLAIRVEPDALTCVV